ncbi:MAG: hypothetical protein WD023_05280 [Ilumatobacteraceae bacterium]
MNDDAPDSVTPSPELDAVASVLDGTAASHEQAVVEASPELQRLLAQLTADRASIADVADVEITTEVREWSIGAALGAYDDMLAGASATAMAAVAASTDATVVRFERRRRTYRAVMGTAAAVIVVLGGIAVFSGLGGSDDEQPASAPPMAASAKTDGNAPSAGDSTRAATSAQGGVIGEEATNDTADITSAASAEVPAATTGELQTAYTIGTGGATVGSDLQTPEDLVAYALGRSAMPASEGTDGACVTEGAEAIGVVTYRGIGAIVVRDPATGRLTAFDLSTCTPLVEAGP